MEAAEPAAQSRRPAAAVASSQHCPWQWQQQRSKQWQQQRSRHPPAATGQRGDATGPRLITPAHAARGLGMLAAVARDRGSERGVTARPEAGSRGHAPSATNAEVKFSDVGGHIRGARHGRQQRLVGGPGGDPHLGGYLGRRPEGWQRRRGAQSQPRLRPTPAGRKSGSTLPPFDLRIIRLCMSTIMQPHYCKTLSG